MPCAAHARYERLDSTRYRSHATPSRAPLTLATACKPIELEPRTRRRLAERMILQVALRRSQGAVACARVGAKQCRLSVGMGRREGASCPPSRSWVRVARTAAAHLSGRPRSSPRGLRCTCPPASAIPRAVHKPTDALPMRGPRRLQPTEKKACGRREGKFTVRHRVQGAGRPCLVWFKPRQPFSRATSPRGNVRVPP